MSVVNKTYEINIPAGESRLIQSGGRYVYCESANLNKFRIAVDDVAEGVIAPGMGYERDADEEPFKNVRVVNDTASALAATILIGTGRILDNRLTLAGVIQVEGKAGGGNPIAVNGEIGELSDLGASKFSIATAALATTTIFTPAANVNGAALRSAFMMIGATGGIGYLVAHTAVPATTTDGRPLISVAGTYMANQLAGPLLLPAGMGLYLMKSSGAGVVEASCGYDLL